MENGSIREFVETMCYNDNQIKYKNKYYFFNGIEYMEKDKKFSFVIYELKDIDGEILNVFYEDVCESAEECVRKFLDAKIWDGKTLYEIEKDIYWIDWYKINYLNKKGWKNINLFYFSPLVIIMVTPLFRLSKYSSCISKYFNSLEYLRVESVIEVKFSPLI